MLPENPENIAQINRRITSRNKTAYLKGAVILFLCSLLIVLTLKIGIPLYHLAKTMNLKPGMVYTFLFNKNSLKNDQGRVNFLIMGDGGATHEGPNLTDSLMFVSLNPKTKETLMVSLPRDIWDESLKGKINSAYAVGEYQEGNGVELARIAVEKIVGQPIHYTAVIDFNAFKEIIDAVGGVDVYVDRSFEDDKYPLENSAYDAATISGKIYETLIFKKGLMHMDGTTALKFSRSRYSTDPLEGSDFARSKRQQKIMVALKNKLLKFNNLSDFNKLEKIYQAVNHNIDTDIVSADFPGLARLALSFDDKKVKSLSLDEGTAEKPGFLINPPPDNYGAWVLVPRSGSWREFQDYIKNEIK